MSLANLVRLNVYTPATTMVGVVRLAVPGQLVELEGIAVACSAW